jgi:hypothetical protein
VSNPWTDDRTVGTINIAHVNVSDLLTMLTTFTLRHGVALECYIEGTTLVLTVPKGESSGTMLDENLRRVVGLHLIEDVLGRIAR